LVLSLAATPLFEMASAQVPDMGDTSHYGIVTPIKINPEVLLSTYRLNTLSPVFNYETYPTKILFDSLKSDAANHSVTNTLYNLLVVSENTGFYRSVNSDSREEFAQYTGKIIRKIAIHSFGPYGTNLENIDINNIDYGDNILNKTHINTKVAVIKNQLFFGEGDPVDPLVMSDNERAIRELQYIYDCRIVIVPLSEREVDVVILTKDVYSLGLTTKFFGTYREGTASIYEKNIFGLGHELSIKIPYDAQDLNSITLGKGVSYNIYNLYKTFTNFRVSYLDSMGIGRYGLSVTRGFYSSTTKYAGGISFTRTQVKEDMNNFADPQYVKYDNRDLWVARSFLIDEEPATRIVLGLRYTYNDAIKRPDIEPHSYQYYQNYQSVLGSISLSSQRYYKNNLIYGYGRTEDIPYGGMINITVGKEFGEFKDRIYTGATISFGQPLGTLGYFHTTLGYASYDYEGDIEQGIFLVDADLISNLVYLGSLKIRNFFRVEYTNGFNRYEEEYLEYKHENGFTGFSNDSTRGTNRLNMSIESVIFGPRSRLGFRIAYFAFGDLGYLFEPNEKLYNSNFLSSIGVGIRLRNDHLVINTISIRLAYYPVFPANSSLRNVILSGEQFLRPANFEPGAPSVIPYYGRRR